MTYFLDAGLLQYIRAGDLPGYLGDGPIIIIGPDERRFVVTDCLFERDPARQLNNKGMLKIIGNQWGEPLFNRRGGRSLHSLRYSFMAHINQPIPIIRED